MQNVLVCTCSTLKLSWTFTRCQIAQTFAGPARHGEVTDETVQVLSYLTLLISLLILNLFKDSILKMAQSIVNFQDINDDNVMLSSLFLVDYMVHQHNKDHTAPMIHLKE